MTPESSQHLSLLLLSLLSSKPPKTGWDGSSCVNVDCSTCMYYDPSYGAFGFGFRFRFRSLVSFLPARSLPRSAKKKSKHSLSFSPFFFNFQNRLLRLRPGLLERERFSTLVIYQQQRV